MNEKHLSIIKSIIRKDISNPASLLPSFSSKFLTLKPNLFVQSNHCNPHCPIKSFSLLLCLNVYIHRYVLYIHVYIHTCNSLKKETATHFSTWVPRKIPHEQRSSWFTVHGVAKSARDWACMLHNTFAPLQNNSLKAYLNVWGRD